MNNDNCSVLISNLAVTVPISLPPDLPDLRKKETFVHSIRSFVHPVDRYSNDTIHNIVSPSNAIFTSISLSHYCMFLCQTTDDIRVRWNQPTVRSSHDRSSTIKNHNPSPARYQISSYPHSNKSQPGRMKR
mmetsp:Transcript_16966/g.24930  ORF Transcript_16966/g.24930 Transcript_16966/m.24930 type:complete len:131 (-) Transcript_16966:9-401(-)